MNTVLNWFYVFYQNLISMIFNWNIVDGVSFGSFLVVLGIFGLVAANLVLLARRN